MLVAAEYRRRCMQDFDLRGTDEMQRCHIIPSRDAMPFNADTNNTAGEHDFGGSHCAMPVGYRQGSSLPDVESDPGETSPTAQ